MRAAWLSLVLVSLVSLRAEGAPSLLFSAEMSRPPETLGCAANGAVVGVIDVADRRAPRYILSMEPAALLQLWRFAPTLGTHPANALLDRYRPVEGILLSANGRYAALQVDHSRENIPRVDPIIDLQGNREIAAEALVRIAGNDVLVVTAFSSTGRYVMLGRRPIGGDDTQENGVTLFDLTAGKVIVAPSGLRNAFWVGDEGRYFSATTAAGAAGVYDRSGERVYPKAGTDPLASSTAIALDGAGRRIALITKGGQPTDFTIRVFDLPTWKEVRRIPLGSAATHLTTVFLSSDGRVVATQRVDASGTKSKLTTSFYDVENGALIGEPARLVGGGIAACGEGARWLWHSGLLPRAPGNREPARFRTDVVDPIKYLPQETEPRR